MPLSFALYSNCWFFKKNNKLFIENNLIKVQRGLDYLYRKNCHKCLRASFSSAEYGKWLCPTCGEDLTVQKAHDALTIERINTPQRNYKKSNIYYYTKKTKLN